MRGAISLRHEVARKALHLTSMVVPLAYAAGLPRPVIAWTLAALAAAAIAVELGRAGSPSVRRTVDLLFARLLREHERDRWSGATWLLLAMLAAVLLFDRATAIAALWAVSAGDAAAALVGRTWGRHRPGRSQKSLEGSVACAATTAAGIVLLTPLTPGAALVGAVAASLAEWPARPLDDNVRVTLATGCGILLWRLAFS